MWVALVGFGASFVDGALGMGFGATGSTLLMGMGLPPQVAAGTVNLAKVATGLASGVSHWKFKNIDKALVLRLGLSGCAGAILGAAVLSFADPGILKLVMSALLTLIGLRLLLRFAAPTRDTDSAVSPKSKGASPNPNPGPTTPVAGVEWAGFLGGVVNGLIGAWGPLVTPFLLYRRVAPRFAIGVSNTAEVFVAMTSAGAIVLGLGTTNFDFRLLAAMLVGGVLAAPVAAWLIRYVPARPMGLATAALLILLNARELISRASPEWQPGLAAAALAVVIALMSARFRRRAQSVAA